MSNSIESFLAKEPLTTQVFSFDEDGKERGVFSARWRSQDFSSLLDFQIFLFRNSKPLQPYLCGMRGEELKPFFKPEPGAEQAARAFHAQHREVQMDAAAWCAQKLAFADFSWLQAGEHTTVMEFVIDGYPEMIASGPAGYMTTFVADILS